MPELADPQAELGQEKIDRERPWISRLEELEFARRVEDKDRFGVFYPQPFAAEAREWVFRVRRQVPPLGGVAVHRPTGFQDEPDTFVAKRSAASVVVAVGGDPEQPQVADKGFRIDLVGRLRRP